MKGARQYPPLGVRMSPELKDLIVRSAEENHRTINSEIVYRLERSMKAEGKYDQPKPA